MDKKYYILFIFLFIGVFAFAIKKKTSKKMVKSWFGKIINGKQIIRACDLAGCGYFGADRDNHTRKHNGVDLIVKEGQKIYAPFSGIVRPLTVYNYSDKMKGIEINNGVYSLKLFYLETPFNNGESVEQGDFIGYAQNVAKFHNKEGIMPIHIHAELRKNGKLINPTKLITQ